MKAQDAKLRDYGQIMAMSASCLEINCLINFRGEKMRKKIITILLAVSVIAMYSFGSIASVFAEGADQSSPSITLDKTEMALTAGGDAGKITASTNPTDATVTWSTSDSGVATVDNGTVTPVSEGSATITAKETVSGTDYTATVAVTVTKADTAPKAPESTTTPESKVELKDVAVINDNTETTYDTIVKAIDAAKDGDTIYVYGTVLWGGDSTESTKAVTITSGNKDSQDHVVLNGANKYSFPTNYGNDDTPNVTNFNCATTLDNIYIETSAGINFMFANGHKLVISSNVTVKSNGSVCSGETSGSNIIAVGGSYQKEVASTDMTLNSGSYEYVIGGGLGQNVTGNASLTTGAYCEEILGGGYRADVGGATDVTVNGDVGVLGGVYGGCYEGNVSGNTNVKINGTVGTPGRGLVAGGSCFKGSVDGSTNVTIGAKGNVGSGVYGGNSDTANDPNPLRSGNNQRYSQKTNEQVLYPAARTIEKSFVGGDTNVTIENGGICNEAVYGGSVDTPVNGSTFVTVNGTVYGEGNAEGVYGGGAYVGADIMKDTNVTIGKTASIPMREVNYEYMGGDTRIGGAVFGGGRFCAVKGSSNVTLNGKVGSEGLGGLVFGGGYGAMKTGTATVEGTSNVTVNVAPYSYTIEKSLGWQQYTDAHLIGNAEANVFCRQTGIFGGGMNSDCDATSVININADLNGNPVYGDGLYEWITGKSTINVNKGGVVDKVWGYYDDEQAGDYYKRAEGDYANVYFNGNVSKAVQINNVDLVQTTNGSDVTIDNNKADNQQLVNVKDLTIDKNSKLTLDASAQISGNYTGDGTGTLVVPAIAVGANNDKGRLAIGGTVTGNTNISIVDAGSVVPAENQVYVTSSRSDADSAFNYKWIDQRNSVAMGYKTTGSAVVKAVAKAMRAAASTEGTTSVWYLVKSNDPVGPVIPTPVAQDTTYKVVANYFTSTDKGTTYKQDNGEEVTVKNATSVKVGDAITVVPETSWSSYSGNTYTLDAGKSTMTKIAVLDASSNTLTVNYYRISGSSNNNNSNNNSNKPDNNNNNHNNNGGTTNNNADNNNTSGPDTGDASNMLPWSILGLTGAVLAAMVIKLREQHDK